MSTVEALGEKATTEHGLGEWLTRAAARLSSVPFAFRTPDGVARRFLVAVLRRSRSSCTTKEDWARAVTQRARRGGRVHPG